MEKSLQYLPLEIKDLLSNLTVFLYFTLEIY